MQQIMSGIREQLHGNTANACFLHALFDCQHAFAGIANRVILT